MMKSRKITVKIIKEKNIKGFLDDEEALRLYELAGVASRQGPCLEIGSYCGKSAAFIGLACQENGSVLFSIDHHRGSEEQQPGQEYFDPEIFDGQTGLVDTFPLFRKTMDELNLSDAVVPLVSPSSVVARSWRTPLSLVFIDGSHTLVSAFSDYSLWVSHLQPGGFLAIHDIFFHPDQGGQAPHCIYKLATASGLFTALPMTKTLGVLQRISPGAISDAARRTWDSLHRPYIIIPADE